VEVVVAVMEAGVTVEDEGEEATVAVLEGVRLQ